jgi:hypothetical protein
MGTTGICIASFFTILPRKGLEHEATEYVNQVEKIITT